MVSEDVEKTLTLLLFDLLGDGGGNNFLSRGRLCLPFEDLNIYSNFSPFDRKIPRNSMMIKQ